MKRKQFKQLLKALNNIQGRDGQPGMLGPQGSAGPRSVGVKRIIRNCNGDLEWEDTNGKTHPIERKEYDALKGDRPTPADSPYHPQYKLVCRGEHLGDCRPIGPKGEKR